ncbi:MAG: metal ABC transporter permease [Lentisphaeria bacterium]|nr:metal ABC transporter permease [Lentisphaeria bacterium]
MIESLISFLADLMPYLFPFDCMDAMFMRRAMLALLFIAPLTAISGIQVVNSRMSFFSDAIGHSAFAGVALGLLCGLSLDLSMPLTAVLVGVIIMFLRRSSRLSSDTVIGVIFSAVAAAGLAIVARDRAAAGNIQMFLFGDILTITEPQIAGMAGLLTLFLIFQFFAYNKLLLIGVNPMLAAVHRVNVRLYQYLFAILLALVVIGSVRASGVILVTALLVVPAAAARNFAASARSMFFLTLGIGYFSCISGLLLAAQEAVNIPAGSAIVLVAVLIFAISLICNLLMPKRQSDSSL